ncbi:hypothetical protein CEXT_29001 [Caerostris extrusa]|uniref:Uncharacterized protein n=1 Tax=Caerostris extrusa TaxID=172846 RepID=A0AAV4U0Q6_CAEEX|nr:hypothetical protein CEXT_29001 [Caerostris extrusa]
MSDSEKLTLNRKLSRLWAMVAIDYDKYVSSFRHTSARFVKVSEHVDLRPILKTELEAKTFSFMGHDGYDIDDYGP